MDISRLTSGYGWIGPQPHGSVPARDLPIAKTLLSNLDRLMSGHPDAMLDIVAVTADEFGTRFCCRLSGSRSALTGLYAKVRAEVAAAEALSAAQTSSDQRLR